MRKINTNNTTEKLPVATTVYTRSIFFIGKKVKFTLA
jgi:hypothetical protein